VNEMKFDSTLRILVTGSRGKSSVVRLLHAALHDAGLRTCARITGVVPRELGLKGVRTISRSSAAHVEEMRWWLRGLPASTQAIILENSAIAQELQALAGRWLRPEITVFTNARPDHQEVWGPTGACAAEVLAAGVPEGGQLILPAGLQTDSYLLELLEHRACTIVFSGSVAGAEESFRAINMGLALSVVEYLGLETASALQAMRRVQQDRYDFRVVNCGGAEVAMAFSANDISSTRTLFQSLLWSEQETRLIYNHRADRPGRFRSFVDWLGNAHWREVLIIGDKPRMRPGSSQYLKIKNEKELLRLFQPGDRVFGCGNIAGLPLSLAADLS